MNAPEIRERLWKDDPPPYGMTHRPRSLLFPLVLLLYLPARKAALGEGTIKIEGNEFFFAMNRSVINDNVV
jgi:hypothetical protein